MKKPVLEIQILGEEVYQVMRQGKPLGPVFSFYDLETPISLTHPFFDIPCTVLPKKIRFNFRIKKNEGKFPIISVTRNKNEIKLDYFISIDGKTNYDRYLLSEYIVVSEIIRMANRLGFSGDWRISESDPYEDVSKKYKAEGNLREKIVKDSALLNKIRAQVENKLIRELKKGKLVARFKALNCCNPEQHQF
jgi:hypothetical protein